MGGYGKWNCFEIKYKFPRIFNNIPGKKFKKKPYFLMEKDNFTRTIKHENLKSGFPI